MSNAAGIYYNQVGTGAQVHAVQAELLKKLSDLLGFILVDLTAECGGGESFHSVT